MYPLLNLGLTVHYFYKDMYAKLSEHSIKHIFLTSLRMLFTTTSDKRPGVEAVETGWKSTAQLNSTTSTAISTLSLPLGVFPRYRRAPPAQIFRAFTSCFFFLFFTNFSARGLIFCFRFLFLYCPARSSNVNMHASAADVLVLEVVACQVLIVCICNVPTTFSTSLFAKKETQHP